MITLKPRSFIQNDLHVAPSDMHENKKTQYSNETRRFTLEPIRHLGEEALLCSDIDGMDFVKLIHIKFLFKAPHRETMSRESDDLFASLQAREQLLSKTGELIKATFSIKFSDASATHDVEISPRDGLIMDHWEYASIVGHWMMLREFIVSGETGATR